MKPRSNRLRQRQPEAPLRINIAAALAFPGDSMTAMELGPELHATAFVLSRQDAAGKWTAAKGYPHCCTCGHRAKQPDWPQSSAEIALGSSKQLPRSP